MRGYIVRNARENDLPALIELLKVTDLFWGAGDTVEVLTQKLCFDHDSIVVLEREKKIIGMVLTTYDPWASFIWHLAIHPEHQGRGLGHKLANEAEHRLRKRGTASICGYVVPENFHSRAFFKKRGWSESLTPIIAIEKPQ